MKYFKEKEFVCRCCGELPPFLTDKLAKAIVENGKYDQLILYPMLPRFVHVSWKRNGGNRLQILRKVGNGYQPVTRKEVLAL